MTFDSLKARQHLEKLAKRHKVDIVWHGVTVHSDCLGGKTGLCFALPPSSLPNIGENYHYGGVQCPNNGRPIVALYNVLDEQGYFSSLHEIGHCVYKRADYVNISMWEGVFGRFPAFALIGELYAWKFAAHKTIYIPSVTVSRFCAAAFATYLRGARKAVNRKEIRRPRGEFYNYLNAGRMDAYIMQKRKLSCSP